MAKSKNDLNIDFKGKTDGLIINVNGKVIYPYKEEAVKKEIHPNKLNTQLKTGVAAVFCGAVNRINPLQQTWKKWPVKSRIPYRNILAANIKRCGTEHPTKANLICPNSLIYLPDLSIKIDAEGIKIEMAPIINKIELEEKEVMIAAAGIFCVYSPREKNYEPCEIYPLHKQLENYDISENYNFAFPFNEEILENVSKYEKCIVYLTLILEKEMGSVSRWFNGYAKELSL
jgi:hypothetical protein